MCQTLKWFGSTTRKAETTNTKVAMKLQPTGKTSREMSRKRQMDAVRKDLKTLEVIYWEDRIEDRDGWKMVSVVAKILTELLRQKRKKVATIHVQNTMMII